MLDMAQKASVSKIQQIQGHCEQESLEQENNVSDVQEQGKKLLKTLSSNIALYFNQIIFLLNKSRKNMEIQLKEDNDLQKIQSKKINNQQQSQKNEESIGMIQQDLPKPKSKGKNGQTDNQQSKPKKPVSSFFVFYQQKSKQLAAKHGEIVGPKIAQIVAQAWNSMNEQQKKPFLQKANQTKQKYKEEMRQYLEQHAVQIQEMRMQKRARNAKLKQLAKKMDKGEINEEVAKNLIEQNDLDSKLKGISLRQMKVEQRKDYSHRPKAPVSSFFIFYQSEAKNIAKQHNVTVGSQLAKLASSIWKAMPNQKKLQYQQKAKQHRQKYHIQMLQYRRDFPEQVEKRKKTLSANMKRKNKKGDLDEDKIDPELSVSSEDSSIGESDIPSNQEEQSDSYRSSTSLKKQEQSLAQEVIQTKPSSPKKIEKTTTKKAYERRDVRLFPHRPKGPICSFFQYYHKNLKTFMNNNTSLQKDPGSQFVRRASAIWKSMSEIEKQPYHNLAKLERERYQVEMQKYKKEYPEEYQRFKVYNKQRHSNPKLPKNLISKIQQKQTTKEQLIIKNSAEEMPEKINIQSDSDSSDSSSDITSSDENLQK